MADAAPPRPSPLPPGRHRTGRSGRPTEPVGPVDPPAGRHPATHRTRARRYGLAVRIDIGDGVRLYVDVDGPGLVPDGPTMVERPTVVLLHGGPGLDHSSYKARTAIDLTDVAQVVFYDHRGHGRSDRRAPDEWRLDVWADDIVRLCDALEIEQPYVVGASFGGIVAQRYLARHPGHAAGVVLACTTPRFDVDVMVATFERVGGRAAADAARDFWTLGPEALGPYLEHCMPLYSVDPGDPEAVGRIVMNLELLAHFQSGEQTTLDLAPSLATATGRVLVLGGDLDPVCPVEMSEEIVAALKGADVTFERASGASHNDVIPRCEAAIRRFVTGVE